jgi:hypothetical protein
LQIFLRQAPTQLGSFGSQLRKLLGFALPLLGCLWIRCTGSLSSGLVFFALAFLGTFLVLVNEHFLKLTNGAVVLQLGEVLTELAAVDQ